MPFVVTFDQCAQCNNTFDRVAQWTTTNPSNRAKHTPLDPTTPMPHLTFGFRPCHLFLNPHQSRRTLTASTFNCRLGNVGGLATMRGAIRNGHSLRDAVVHIETPRTPEDTDDTKRVGFLVVPCESRFRYQRPQTAPSDMDGAETC